MASICLDEPEWLGVLLRGLNSFERSGVALNGLEWWVVVSAPEWLGYSLSGVERHRMVLRTVRAFMGFEWRRVAYAVGRDALGPDTLVMTRVMTT